MQTGMEAATAVYLGPITDTSRWRSFKSRADDIFICTPPKCGTTWTQAICAMLVFGSADHGLETSRISPWIDAQFAPIDEYLETVDALPHRRFIKTHTPFDGIPYSSSATYLVILRDPRDVFFSGLDHRDNMTDAELANTVFPTGEDAFRVWLSRERDAGQWDVVSLESLTHFLTTYWRQRARPNVHLFHYSDMKRDLARAVQRMADALGVDLTPAELESYTKAASFNHMKARARQFAPEAGTGMWKAEANFFAAGRHGQWQERLSKAEQAAFDARMSELLTGEQADWLLNGNGA